MTWISVDERLPDTKQMVLVYSDDKCCEPGTWNAMAGMWVDYFPNEFDDSITHWMPLPEPPG